MIVARWDDRLGVTPEASFPEGIGDLLEHDDLLTIFSTHAISEKAGILAMRIKRLNIVSYYSGLPEGDKTEQYFVVVILEQEEDPNTFEERLTEIAKMIIASANKPGFSDMFAQFYDQLIKMDKINEEQRYSFIFRDKIRRLLLEKLTNGPMTKEGLGKWISKEIDEEVTDIDSLLGPLKKTELIEEVNISKGKKVTLEYVFLMRDVAIIRVPNVEIFRDAVNGKMPEDIREKYIEVVEKYFKEYRISSPDAGVLGEVVSNPDSYEVIKALREEYMIRAELPMKLSRDVAGLDNVLKDLADKNIITAIKDKKGRVWVFLLSDVKFPNFFPEYMIDVIRRRWKEGTIAKEIALRHMELLRAEYIATQAPKYRKKMIKTIRSFFSNAETLIKKGQYEQAATVLDTMASHARDMGERNLGELLDSAGKQLREDKEGYLEDQYPQDREQILQFLEDIEFTDSQKGKKKTAKTIDYDDDADEPVKSVPKNKKKKSKGTYQEPEVQDMDLSYSSSGQEPSVEQSAPQSGYGSDPAKRKKEIMSEIKKADKNKDYLTRAELMGKLADTEDELGKTKVANSLREKSITYVKKGYDEIRIQAAKAAKAAMKKKDYARAADLYEQCKDISNKLFKQGMMNEADNQKKFASAEADARSKMEQ